MKKLLFLLLLFVSTMSEAQHLQEDDEGNSSVLLPVGNISFNTTKTQLQLSYVRGIPSVPGYMAALNAKKIEPQATALNALDSIRMKRFVIGGFLGGENDDGTRLLINDQRFTPGGETALILGYRFDKAKLKDYRNFEEQSQQRQKLIPRVDSLLQIPEKDIADAIYLLKSSATTYTWKAPMLAELERIYALTLPIKMVQGIAQLLNAHAISSTDPVEQKLFDDIRMLLSQAQLDFENTRPTINQLNGANNERRQAYMNIRSASDAHAILFAKAQYFKRDFKLLTSDKSNPDSLYKKAHFNGYNVSLNLNLVRPQNRFILGMSAGVEQADNYDTLTKVKIQSTTVMYTDNSRTDKKNDEINAAQGTYFSYRQIPLAIDALWFFPGNEKESALALGGYFRYAIRVKTKSDEQTWSDHWKAGISLNMFNDQKAKFVGGGYLQLENDVEGPGKKIYLSQMITIGLTTKFNIIPLDMSQ